MSVASSSASALGRNKFDNVIAKCDMLKCLHGDNMSTAFQQLKKITTIAQKEAPDRVEELQLHKQLAVTCCELTLERVLVTTSWGTVAEHARQLSDEQGKPIGYKAPFKQLPKRTFSDLGMRQSGSYVFTSTSDKAKI